MMGLEEEHGLIWQKMLEAEDQNGRMNHEEEEEGGGDGGG